MTRQPWWYSGEEPAAERPDEPAAEQSRGRSVDEPGDALDWTALAVGAQRLVDWATERVVAPHAEHDNPREHPGCVMCRALALMADRPGTANPPAGPPDPIMWIPIVGEAPEPDA